MWESDEAQKALVSISKLLSGTTDRLRLVRAKGTEADRVRATGVGIEVLVGIVEAYEFDQQFRRRVRDLSDRWVRSDGSQQSVQRATGSTLILLERLQLMCASLVGAVDRPQA